MVRRDVAMNRIARASARLNDADRWFGMDAEQSAPPSRSAISPSSTCILALQVCIDLAAHWVADAGWGVPDDAGSTFDELADRLREGVGLRSRIAHAYALVDYSRVRLDPKLRVEFAAGYQPSEKLTDDEWPHDLR